MARITVHVDDTPRRSWLEIDGQRVEGVEAVPLTTLDGEPVSCTLTINQKVTVVDERTKIAGADDG
ncbi:MAG: hypothetical protein ACLGI3_17690 [Actinomycetes bacterium]